jgi:hypothetical protein
MLTGLKTKKARLLVAAGFGMLPLAPFLIAADNANPPAVTAADQSNPFTTPAGFQTKDLDAQSGIRNGLVKLTDRAAAKGDFNRFLAELTTQDKDRAREYKGTDQSKLDSIIDQIQTAWKNKYGQELSINDKSLVFDQRYAMAEFEVADPAVALNNWPAATVAGQAITAGSHSDADSQKDQEKNAKLTKGTDVALVRIPAANGMPEMTVSMLHQMLFWRVDLPNDRTGEQIYSDLILHLIYLRDHQDQWPADVADGYRMVAAHAVAAVYGINVPGNAG